MILTEAFSLNTMVLNIYMNVGSRWGSFSTPEIINIAAEFFATFIYCLANFLTTSTYSEGAFDKMDCIIFTDASATYN